MRKQIRWRSFVSFLLAFSLVFMGSVSAFAEDPAPVELGDIGCLAVTSGESDDEIHYECSDGQADDLPNGSTITAGTVDDGLAFGTIEEDEDWGTLSCTEDFAGQVTVKAGDVGSKDGECPDIAVWVNASGKDTAVSVETGELNAVYTGALIDNADASVEVSTKGITVSGESEDYWAAYGVYLGDSSVVDIFGDSGEGDAYTGDKATTTVLVDGDINVNSEEFFSTGISVGSSPVSPLTNGDITVEVTGSLTATGCYGQGITVYENGGTAGITVGSVHAEGEAASYGAVIANYGANSSASVTVNEGISSKAEDLALGISALTTNNGAEASVTVQSGGITVSGDSCTLKDPNPFDNPTAAVITRNAGGSINISVVGDVTSTGYGVMLFDSVSVREEEEEEDDEEEEDEEEEDGDVVDKPSNTEGKQEGSEGTNKTLVEVVGDVAADECGVYLNLQHDSSSMDVLIDGTLSGENTSVLLSRETVIDDLTLTVWEVKANDDGNLVERIDNWTEDDKDYSEEMSTVADRDLEKKIQYIIKIDPAWQKKIGAKGTTVYKPSEEGTEYQVAYEGDRITLLKLDIPEGKQIAVAYWDKNKSASCKLLQDSATGEYYLTVPRGGGVWLSVTLEDIPDDPEPDPEPKPEPDPKPEPEPEPDPDKKHAVAAPILTIWDLDNKIEINFFKGGNFEVTLEDGSPETGHCRFENDQLVLEFQSGIVTVNADEVFTYTSVTNAQVYQFKMSQAEIDTLK